MRVGIVGAGVTGLTVALELLRRGHQVVAFEQGQVGGLAGGFPFPGQPDVYLEKFYHHIFMSDAAVLGLIEQFGLKRDMLWLPSKSGLIAKGRVWPMRGPLDLLRFRPLGGLGQRLRMGFALRSIQRTSDWRPLDAVRCREFFERRGAVAGYRRFWEPLLKQKFDDAYDDIPAAFLWGRIYPRARSRRRGVERLGYLRGGFQRLFLRMADTICAHGGELHTSGAVDRVACGSQPELRVRGRSFHFDRIVWTGSLERLAAVVADPPEEFRDRARAIEYVAATQLILILRRRQSNFYWLNNLDPDLSFGVLIEHTNLVPPEHYGGEHILYVGNYHRPADPRFAGRSAEELFALHAPSLKKILPRFHREDVLRMYAIRARDSSPLYDLGFSQRIPPYQGWLPYVDICGMAQVYPEDRNMSHGVDCARQYVEKCY